MSGHLLQGLLAGLGVHNLNHLNFVKLVLSDHPPCVSAMRPSLRTKARGVGGQLDGQIAFTQNRVAYKIGEGDLTGGDQIKRCSIGLRFCRMVPFGQVVGLTLSAFFVANKSSSNLGN